MADWLGALSTEEAMEAVGYLRAFFDEVNLVDAQDGGCALVAEGARVRYELAGDMVSRIVSKPVAIRREGGDAPCAIEAVSRSTVVEFAKRLQSNPAVARALLEEMERGAEGRPSAFRFPMPLLCSRFEPGAADAAIEDMEDETTKSLARVEFAYLRGSFETVARDTEGLMHASKDISVRAAAGLWNTMANMACGYPATARRAKAETENLCEAGIGPAGDPQVRAACTIVDSTIASFFPGGRAPQAPIEEAVAHLPEGRRLYASYLIALQAYNRGEYGHSLGVASTALTLCANDYPVSVAYLRTIAACDYMALHAPEEAKREFAEAWRLTAADGIVSPFVEHYVPLRGLPEACLKASDPALYRGVSKAAVAYRTGWISLVDPEEAQVVASSSLTASELSVAALAKCGWSNREIAVHLGISANTVKHRLSSVFQKAGIDRRADLARFKVF